MLPAGLVIVKICNDYGNLLHYLDYLLVPNNKLYVEFLVEIVWLAAMVQKKIETIKLALIHLIPYKYIS